MPDEMRGVFELKLMRSDEWGSKIIDYDYLFQVDSDGVFEINIRTDEYDGTKPHEPVIEEVMSLDKKDAIKLRNFLIYALSQVSHEDAPR
jgi:hypothetical protein